MLHLLSGVVPHLHFCTVVGRFNSDNKREKKSNCFLCVQTKSRSPKPENRTVGLVSSSTVQMLSNHRHRADTTHQGSIGGSTKSFRSLTCQAVTEQSDKQ